MAPKTIKRAIADTLEDLSQNDFEKFCHRLLDSRDEEPKIRRRQVEGKNYLAVTDVLVNRHTETGALVKTLELLREIGCHDDALQLEKETLFSVLKSALSSKPASSGTATPSAGAEVATPQEGNATGGEDEHFVDKHRLELTQRVSCVPPILDDLLHKKVIKQEVYNEIMALPTSQERMRAIYRGPLQGGPACKEIFYKSLVENEKYLIDHLKGKK